MVAATGVSVKQVGQSGIPSIKSNGIISIKIKCRSVFGDTTDTKLTDDKSIKTNNNEIMLKLIRVFNVAESNNKQQTNYSI